MNFYEKIEEILTTVRRPSWYMGREINAVVKNWKKVSLKIALSYPDLYELGMSNTALKILYGLVNDQKDLLAERVFAPLPDMEATLREKGWPLFSLETRHALRDFDLIGITLPHELCYTNILTILDLGGIPLKSSERDQTHPIVIGGGAGAFNPESIADFFDLFVLGDGEEVLLEIADLLKEHHWYDPLRRPVRLEMLRILGKLQGIYVPALFTPAYHPDGTLQEMRGSFSPGVEKRILADLNTAYFPKQPILPYAKVTHNRIAVEAQRGCTHGCKFCQAGYIDRPVRQRSPEKIRSIVKEQVLNTGCNEVGLLSLSIGDYSSLPELARDIMNDHREEKVALSVPSTRVEQLSPDLMNEISKVRKTGFTIAPEAATDRMRHVINKGNDERDLMRSVRRVYELGWDLIKLYFMIGLPSEKDEDVIAIATLAEKVLKVGRDINPRAKVTVSVSTFVPKPHTAFQWVSQITREETKRRQLLIRKNLKSRQIRFKWHESNGTYLEGVFSRGDRRLNAAILKAWELGCRLDAWDEYRRLDLWFEAFKAAGLDPDWYHRGRSRGEILPWDHLFAQLKKDFLWIEFEKTKETYDCCHGPCYSCGVCDYDEIVNRTYIKVASGSQSEILRSAQDDKNHIKYACTFAKDGPLAPLSHLEVVEAIRRAVQRAKLPVKFSEGFHPQPRLSFGQALKVGCSSQTEPLGLELMKELPTYEIMDKLNRELPQGLRLMSCERN